MSTLMMLIRRNIKLYFKDKGMFFSSLITPIILLVLYTTFLGNIFEENFRSALEMMGGKVSDELIHGCVAGQLVSSLLAVSCVTVAFCSNFLMVQDKVTGARRDLTISPVQKSTIALGYYIATLISTLLVCLTATGICLLYMLNMGWYMTAADVGCLILDVFLLALFGTALSSIINYFLTSEGQISAVGTIISAGYGFICGAYMPISSFSNGLQKVLSFLPGTYGTSLLRNHTLRGAFAEMSNQKFPAAVVESIKDSLDCNLTFFGTNVELSTMYLILGGSVLFLIVAYILVTLFVLERHK